MRAKPKAAVNPQWNQRLKIVEEFGALDREVRNFKPRLLRHEKLRNLIIEWFSTLEPGEEATLPGKTCDSASSKLVAVRAGPGASQQPGYMLYSSAVWQTQARASEHYRPHDVIARHS